MALGANGEPNYFDPTAMGQRSDRSTKFMDSLQSQLERTRGTLESEIERANRTMLQEQFPGGPIMGDPLISAGPNPHIIPTGQFYDHRVYPQPQEESFFTDTFGEPEGRVDGGSISGEDLPVPAGHMASLGQLFPFITVPASWQWWRGPNVCSMTEETQERSDSDETIGSYHFADCQDTGKRYECVNRMLFGGSKKTLRVTFECCEGYHRRRGGFCEEANLRPVEDTIKLLGSEEFLSLCESAGVISIFRKDNITVFLPPPTVVQEYQLMLQDTNDLRERRRLSKRMGNDGSRRNGDRFERRKRKKSEESKSLRSSSTEANSQERKSRTRTKSNASLQGIVTEDMKDTLSCHVADGSLEMTDFMDEKVLYTEAKSSIRINVYRDHPEGPVMTANCAPMTHRTDFPASNGVVHQIESMLKPVTRTLAEILKSDPELSTLYNLMSKGNMHALLEDESQHLTLLAPTNEAFNKLDPTTLAGLEQGEACGQMILTYLTMPRSVCSAAIQGAVLGPTLLGEPMRLEKRRFRMFAGEDGARVARRDIVATNGVMHVLDDVVMPPSAQKMSDVLREGGLNSFLNMLDEAGLLSQINTMTNVTIFAPSDDAIERLGQKTLREMKDDPAGMRDWLMYHITQPQMRACDMPISTMLQSGIMDKGVRLKVHSPGIVGSNPLATRATVECALIKQYDGQACGGVVHVIERTLSAPNARVVEMAKSDADLSIFNQILERSGLGNQFDTDGPWTLLAPVDEAFLRKMPPAILNNYLNTTESAKSLIEHHVLRDVLCCSGIPSSIWAPFWPHRAMDHSPVNFHRDRFHHVYAEHAQIIACDLTATNGVIHKLDHVLDNVPQPRYYGGYQQYYPKQYGFMGYS